MALTDQQAFGSAYKRWMQLNNLPQQCSHDLAKAAQESGLVTEGSAPYAPWNSQCSLLCNGRLLPKPSFFVSLGNWNAVLAAKQFPPNISRQLKDKLLAAEPFRDDDGKVVDAVGFFAMFVGMAPIPKQYEAIARTFTEADAAQATADLRDRFRAYAQAEMLSPAEAWQHVAANIKLTSKQQARLKEVLSGWAELTVEELNEGLPVVVGSVFSGT